MDDVREFVEMLRDPNPGVRRFALQRLSQIGDRAHIPLVRQATQDPDTAVAYQAEQSLSILLGRNLDAHRQRMPALRERSVPGPGQGPGRRPPRPMDAAAAAALRRTGLAVMADCTRRLIEFVESPNPRVAQAAVSALGKIADPLACDALAAGLAREPIAQECAMALAAISDPRGVDTLLSILESNDARLVRVVLAALDSSRDERVIQQLLNLTLSADAEIRADAVFLLGELSEPAIVDRILFLLNDASDLVASRTIDALRKLNYPGLVDLVVSRFADAGNKRVRATLLTCLLRHQADERVIALLDGALADPDPRVRANAVEAVAGLKVPPERKLALLDRVGDDVNNRVLANLAVALGPIDAVRSLTVLTRLLNSRDKWERASAVYAAGFIKEARVGSWLANTLMFEDDEDVLRNTISSLARFRDPTITEQLLKGLSHTKPMVRFGTARILGQMRDRSCRAALIAAIEVEASSSVKAEMVTALAALSDASHVPQLVRFLKDPDPRVQANVIEALDAIGSVEIIPHVKPFITSLDNRVKANAAKALWTQGILDTVTTLREMLDSTWEREVLSAIYALGEIGRTLSDAGDSHRYFILSSSLRERARELSADQAPPRPPESAVLAELLCGHWSLFLAYARGQYREALDSCEEVIARAGSAGAAVHPVMHYLAGESSRKLERYEKAGQHLVAADAQDGRFVGVQTSLASMYHQTGDTSSSVTHQLRALKRRVELVAGEIELALSMIKADRLDDASLMLRSLVELPADSRIHSHLGGQALRFGDLEKAFHHLVLAFVEEPAESRVVHDLGCAAQRLGHTEVARLLASLLAGQAAGTESGAASARDLVAARIVEVDPS
jgi:HEAT repeat protein